MQAMIWVPLKNQEFPHQPYPASRAVLQVPISDAQFKDERWKALSQRQAFLTEKRKEAGQKPSSGQTSGLQQQLPLLGQRVGPYSFLAL